MPQQVLVRAYKNNCDAKKDPGKASPDFEIRREGSELKAYSFGTPLSLADLKKKPAGFVRVEFWWKDDLWALLPTQSASFFSCTTNHPNANNFFSCDDSAKNIAAGSRDLFIEFNLPLQVLPLDGNLTFSGSIGMASCQQRLGLYYADVRFGNFNSGGVFFLNLFRPILRTPDHIFDGIWKLENAKIPTAKVSNRASKMFFGDKNESDFPDISRAVKRAETELAGRKVTYFSFVVVKEAGNNFDSADTPLKLSQGEQIQVNWRPTDKWVHGEDPEFTSSINLSFPERAGLGFWNEYYAQPFLSSLTTAKRGAPATFIPRFAKQPTDTDRTWQTWIVFGVKDGYEGKVLGIQPAASGNGPGKVTAIFPHIFTTGTQNLTALLNVGSSEEVQLSEETLGPARVCFHLSSFAVVGGNVGVRADTIRVGALDLTFADGGIGLEMSAEYLQQSRAEKEIVFKVDVHGKLPLARVAPGGQDDLPYAEYEASPTDRELSCSERQVQKAYRGEPPLVLAGPSPDMAGSLQLKLSETNFPGTHSISLEIQTPEKPGVSPNSGASKIKNEVLIIDRTPFLVAMVRYEPFETEAGSGTLVASWNNGKGSVWQIKARRKPFELVLPPQGIGEQMIKGTEGPIDSALDYRFSPTASQMLYSSYTPQRYVEAPWNLRMILGYAGQSDPGAEIVELQYELLYGLSCFARAPLLRLAEVSSTMGRIPGPLIPPPGKSAGSIAAIERYQQYWTRIHELYNSRLAVYEPRRSGANYGRFLDPTGEPTEMLTLSEGVQCSFREGADLYIKIPHGSPSDDAPFDIRDSGLKGGVTYGFEAPRVFNATVRNPNSSSAQVTAPFFSALGGWGMQKVGFDDDKTIIAADTSMGRTSSYSITRMGRIAVYHNLAKHVIKYERSVAPARFDQDPTKARFEHDPTIGWPILRKVKEYVEILEERKEVGDKGPNPSCAFVKRIHFKTKVIDVESSWGANVGDSGWALPLWQRNGSPYLMPDITFELEDANGVDVECAIESPEKLVFYTDTRANQDRDPRKWPLVPKIDYVPLPRPRPCAGYLSGDIAERIPSEREVPLGYDAFTLTLGDIGPGANVMAGRTRDTHVAAAVRNITMVRAAADFVVDELDPALKSVQQSLDKLQVDSRNLLARETDTPQLVAQLKDLIPRAKQDLADSFNNLAKQAQTLVDGALSQEMKRIESFMVEFRQTLVTSVGEVHTRIDLLKHTLLENGKISARRLASALDQEQSNLSEQLAGLQVRVGALPTLANRSIQILGQLSADLTGKLGSFKEVAGKLFRNVTLDAPTVEILKLQIRGIIFDVTRLGSYSQAEIARGIESWMPQFNLVFENCASMPMRALIQKIEQFDTDLSTKSRAELQSELENIKFDGINVPDWLTKPAKDWPKQLQAQIQGAAKDIRQQVATVLCVDCTLEEFNQKLNTVEPKLSEAVASSTKDVRDWLADKVKTLTTGKAVDQAKSLLDGLKGLESSILQRAGQELDNLASSVDRLLKAGSIRDVQQSLAAAEKTVEEAFESVAAARQEVSAIAEQSAANAARMLRAFGKPPELPNLGFSLPEIAYYYRPGLPQVDLTPVLSRLQDIGLPRPNINGLLSPIGTSLPCVQLLDHLVPPDLTKFDLSDVLPDFAGLKLKGLLSNMKLPSGAQDHIHITHGLDQQRRRAWVRADVNFDTAQPATLFSFGPLKLELPNANFWASVEMSVESDRSTRRKTQGIIKGDWRLSAAGTEFLTLKKTALTFDDGGNLKFEVSPSNIQLSGALSFIADLAKSFSSDSGFSFGILPTGFESRLDLPIPDIQSGTSGISGLRLSSRFAVHLLGPAGFQLETGFSLGRPDAPFSLTVFILGGGGYLDVSAKYAPATGALECSVKVAIMAGASLAIALGPLQGGVYVHLGFTADFHFGGGAASGASLGILLVIRGSVSILGIVLAYVGLSLSVSYERGVLTGRGHFSISIKICWCFTLEVSSDIEYSLGSSQRSSTWLSPDEPILLASALEPGTVSDAPAFMFPQSNPVDYNEIAGRYLNMFA